MTHLQQAAIREIATRVRPGLRIVGVALGLGVAVWLHASASLADSFLVDLGASVQANDGYNQGPSTQVDDFSVHSNVQPSVTGSVSAAVTNVTTASADGTAALGSLRGSTSVTAGGVPNPVFTNVPVAGAQITTTWEDILTVTSNTLVSGAAAAFRLTENVDAVMTSVGTLAAHYITQLTIANIRAEY